MRLHCIETALLSPELTDSWNEILQSWSDARAEDVNMVLAWAQCQRDQFLEAAREIADPETLDMIVAVRYIELKSHWILLNTQINYANVYKGVADEAAMYRASLISGILQALETLIDDEDIERILEFLTEPVTIRERVSDDSSDI